MTRQQMIEIVIEYEMRVNNQSAISADDIAQSMTDEELVNACEYISDNE